MVDLNNDGGSDYAYGLDGGVIAILKDNKHLIGKLACSSM
tara:strand:- start:292 stop:411 length:120 start_codon:yes stop_codon:yes gene_type:complete